MDFRLFDRFEDVSAALGQGPAQELYGLLAKLRQAVATRTPGWAAYPTLVDYANICFWAIRKLEYSLVTDAFAAIEAKADGPLRVLDVGCGVVPLCNWLSRRGHSVTAVDPREADIEFLVRNKLNNFYDSRVTYLTSRCEQLPFASESFDVVTFVSVLEHIPPGNDRVALWEIGRVLKPGGKLVLTFDVAPPRLDQPWEQPWPSHRRRYARPFAPELVQQLLDHLSHVFAVSPADVPEKLTTLTWDEVHAFWRASQGADERTEPIRHYLALGGVLQRRQGEASVPSADRTTAYLEGQAALEDRVLFYQAHAHERLQLIKQLEVQLASAQTGQASQVAEKHSVGDPTASQARDRPVILLESRVVDSPSSLPDEATSGLPTIFHVTHWKAGSQWIHKILRECVPQRIIDPQAGQIQFLNRPLRGGMVYPTIYLTRQDFHNVRLPSDLRLFVVIRDLRDTLISAYFSFRLSHPILDYWVARTRTDLTTLNLEEGLIYLMDEWLHTCADIQLSWFESGEALIHYEDLLDRDVEILQQTLIDRCQLPVSPDLLRQVVLANRFDAITKGRQRGQERLTAHERKGVAGDWRNHFTEPVKQAFKARYGALLVATGYERDLDW